MLQLAFRTQKEVVCFPPSFLLFFRIRNTQNVHLFSLHQWKAENSVRFMISTRFTYWDGNFHEVDLVKTLFLCDTHSSVSAAFLMYLFVDDFLPQSLLL